eukprot:8880807-Pyramimonas_sp.AAC.1
MFMSLFVPLDPRLNLEVGKGRGIKGCGANRGSGDAICDSSPRQIQYWHLTPLHPHPLPTSRLKAPNSERARGTWSTQLPSQPRPRRHRERVAASH